MPNNSFIIFYRIFSFLFAISLLISITNKNLVAIGNSIKFDSITSNIEEYQDSIPILDTISLKMSDKKINPIDFKFANFPRYTMTGELPNLETKMKLKETLLIGGSLALILGGQHYMQTQTIYKDRSNFRFIEDGSYAFYSDKGGHLFGAYFGGYIFSESFMTMGMSKKTAGLWGSFLGLGYETYIEIMDGFGSNWGFSWSDYAFNLMGFSLFFGQNYVDELQYFVPKFMYFPSRWNGETNRIPSDIFVDDYSSQTIWLSINVYGLLPKEVDFYWPKWLNISLGYAVRNLNEVCVIEDPEQRSLAKVGKLSLDGCNYGNPKYILALDYNLVELFPKTDIAFLNWLIQTANYIKWPAPAIEFGQETKFMLLYPFIEF